MTKSTTPIFIVGTGRSGTRSMYKLFLGNDSIDVYHEYLCTHIQKISAKYYMNIITEDEVISKINEIYKSSIFYSQAKIWIDSSNKLSWIINILSKVFPNSKFINIIRDGRKVTNSYYRKLSDEIYDDKSVNIMTKWLENQKTLPEPPPEKKYWWNIPQKKHPFYKEFNSFDQFERICYHWVICNQVILDSFKKLPKDRYRTFKLEELTTNKITLKNLTDFIEIDFIEDYFTQLQTPQNVIFPMDFKLTEEQKIKFDRICSIMMKKLNYTDSEYEVVY